MQAATGLSEVQVKVITRHSGRTSLPHCSKARDGPPPQRPLEIAGWLRSRAALDALPADQIAACIAAMTQARVPAGYSSASTFEVPCTAQSKASAVKDNYEAVCVFTSREDRPVITDVSDDFDPLPK